MLWLVRTVSLKVGQTSVNCQCTDCEITIQMKSDASYKRHHTPMGNKPIVVEYKIMRNKFDIIRLVDLVSMCPFYNPFINIGIMHFQLTALATATHCLTA